MTSDVEAVQAWLQASYSVQVPHEWLTACVEWIQQENGGVTVAGDQLRGLVFEQWLLSDLRELGPGPVCLPLSLSDSQCTHVTGPVALQVDSMLDVGVPLYGQLQRVKGTFNNNTEVTADKPQQPPWEPKPSRMMLLKMTDGQTEVQGMEYQPIPALTPDLQPGAKVVVHGLVKCRRGVLLLTADNLQVLGGEVDSLMEENTPVTVLERAMELGATHNGKHAKQNFSGRFIQQQDFKSSSCPQSKFKVEPSSSSMAQTSAAWQGGKAIKNQPQSQPWTGGGGDSGGEGVKREPQSKKWGAGMKQEPPSQSHAAVHDDDEWEEDLDYGGLLDEPMEDEEALLGSGDHPADRVVGGIHSDKLKHNTWGPVSSLNQQSRQQTPLPANGGVMDDVTWEEDDDFDLAQVETDVLTPVTPGPTNSAQIRQPGTGAHTSTHHASSQKPLSTSANKPNSSRMNVNRSSKSSSSINFGKPLLKPGGVNSVVRSLSSETTSKPPPPPSSPPRSQKSSSSDSSKPPPAKQRKLTAMFSRVKSEPVSQSAQQSAGSVVDLTDNDVTAVSNADSNVECETLKGAAWVGSKTQGGLIPGGLRSSQQRSAMETREAVDQVECQDVDMGDDSSVKGVDSVAGGSSGEVVKLKTAFQALSSPTSNTLTYTIRGYITTLTDRLRSCQGEQWTLSCRITDGTATLEVAIADTVLAGLIGFTARESVALRQQARKDAAVKEALSQGLQKCQQYLVEFQGLIGVQRKQRDSKPCLVHMVKEGTKKR